MDSTSKNVVILTQKVIDTIASNSAGLRLMELIPRDFYDQVKLLINSHVSLLAANAELSFKNMELKKQIPLPGKSSPVIVFTNFESGQRGYETFQDDQEASERFEYLSMYYSEGIDLGVEIGIAEVTRLEKHNWSE